MSDTRSTDWQDRAFRHQWAALPKALREGTVRADDPKHDELGGLPPAKCTRCNAASAKWRLAQDELDKFLEECTAAGKLTSVPREHELWATATRLRDSGHDDLSAELLERIDSRNRTLDSFARAKEQVLGPVLDRMTIDRVRWAVLWGAGLTPPPTAPSEEQEAEPGVAGRCLRLALRWVGARFWTKLDWLLRDCVWPQRHHCRSTASILGKGEEGMQTYVRLRLVSDVLIPAANDAQRPLEIRALATLAILAIGSARQASFRREARELRFHLLVEEAGEEALGEIGPQLHTRRGDFARGTVEDDFDTWLPKALARVEQALTSLEPEPEPDASATRSGEAPIPVRDDRRSEPRIEVMNLVSAAKFNELGFMTGLEMGRTLDLSHDGMRLQLSDPLPVRATLKLSFALGERVVEVHGQVRSVYEIDDHTFGHGIRFVDLSTDDYEAIDEYLQLRATGEETTLSGS